MENNLLSLELDDNVGDGLAKINYNLLNINQECCTIDFFYKENTKFLDDLENLMDRIDVLLPDINYDFLEKLEANVQVLSSYWNNLEMTVQYPFNPINGYVSSIVAAGELGSLVSRTTQNEQIDLIADTLVKQGVYSSSFEAKEGIDDLDMVIVFRDDNGNFTYWQYLYTSLVLNFTVDNQDNLYYNERLVDVYRLPYFSVIAPRNIDLSIQGTTVDFDDKVIYVGNNIIQANRETLNNSFIQYTTITRRQLSQTEETLDVTTYIPTIRDLSEIIPVNNPTYKAKIKKFNDDVLESVLQNPLLNTISLRFLNKSYAPNKYVDGNIINVVFFLYNTIGLNTSKANIATSYYGLDVTTPRNTAKVRTFQNEITEVAPSSNTTFSVNFSKNDVYVDRIVIVKYKKVSKVEFITNQNTGKITPRTVHYWEFVNANIGPKYRKGNRSKVNVDNAPVYVRRAPTVSEIKLFPTQILTKSGDILNDKKGNTFLIEA